MKKEHDSETPIDWLEMARNIEHYTWETARVVVLDRDGDSVVSEGHVVTVLKDVYGATREEALEKLYKCSYRFLEWW